MSAGDPDTSAEHFGDPWQAGFWEAAGRGVVAVQRCTSGHHQFPGGPRCGTCGAEVSWVEPSGEGEVWSWAVFHREYFPEFAAHLPYTVLIVALDEGPRMYTALHPDEDAMPFIGARVRLEVADYVRRPVPLARLVG